MGGGGRKRGGVVDRKFFGGENLMEVKNSSRLEGMSHVRNPMVHFQKESPIPVVCFQVPC